MGFDVVAGYEVSIAGRSVVEAGGIACWFGSEELVRPAYRRVLLGLVGCS